MSAKKLGRFAGLVAVLAALIGGVSASPAAAAGEPTTVRAMGQIIDWN